MIEESVINKPQSLVNLRKQQQEKKMELDF